MTFAFSTAAGRCVNSDESGSSAGVAIPSIAVAGEIDRGVKRFGARPDAAAFGEGGEMIARPR